jgi:hypothetical protein
MSILMTCAVLAMTAPAAHAQMGWEPTPQAPAMTPSPSDPASVSLSTSLEPLRLGMPLQMGASLATFRWFEMAMGQFGFRQMPVASPALQGAARSAWWRKRS